MPSQTESTSLDKALENSGFRMTWPRREVLRVLESRREGFTVEDIVAEMPHLGRATVYRTIKLLQDLEIVCRLSLPDGRPRYMLTQQRHHHHHTMCVTCGQAWEFRTETLERLLHTLRSEVPGDLVGHRVDLYVRCSACAARDDTSALAATEARHTHDS